MNCISVFFPLLFVLCCVAFGDDQTYGELAATSCPDMLKQTIACAGEFDKTTMPSTPFVKPCRGSLRDIRNCLDIFVYAYPTESSSWSKDKDPFIEVRGDLDDGYTLIGDFRDLSFVNASKKDIDAERDLVLQWRDEYLQHEHDHDYSKYVSQPSAHKLHDRSSKVLSQFFWADAGITPLANLSGMQNLARLPRGVLTLAVQRYPVVYNLTLQPPLDPNQQVTLHEYRKLDRALLAVNSLFWLFRNSSAVDQAIETLDDLYDNFGDEEDKISVYNYYLQHGSHSQIAEAEDELAKQTAKVNAWLNSVNIPAILQLLISMLLYNA